MTALPDPALPFGRRLMAYWAVLFRLGWPVMLSRAGLLVMAFTDIVMVGRTGTAALAALALGYAVFVPMMVTGIGTMTGIVSVVARTHGNPATRAHAPEAMLRGLRWAILVGLVMSVLVALAEPFLALIGHDPVLVAEGGAVARALAPGAGFQVLFVAASFYLEGTGRPVPALMAMIAGNLVNILLNLALISGGLGLPAMGEIGAALASTLARGVMAAGLVAYVLTRAEFAPWWGRPPSLWGPGGWSGGAEMRRIGVAGGAAYFFETGAFATLAQAAGLLGADALATYTILHNAEAMVFMTALGLSVATAVLVGQAAGRGDWADARFAGLGGLGAGMALIAAIGVAVVAFAPAVAGIYSTDPALIARAAPLFAIVAISLVFDAGQVIMGQSTRALGDSWGTTLRFFIAFWCVMVPTGVGLAFLTPLAEAGLFIGTAMGCATAVVLLTWRFNTLIWRRADGG